MRRILENSNVIYSFRLNQETMAVLSTGILGSMAFTHKNHRSVKHFFHSKVKMGRFWWLGQLNVVIVMQNSNMQKILKSNLDGNLAFVVST